MFQEPLDGSRPGGICPTFPADYPGMTLELVDCPVHKEQVRFLTTAKRLDTQTNGYGWSHPASIIKEIKSWFITFF